MTAPAARTLAEIVAEGRRLERPNEPGPKGQRAVFWAEYASLFLAVAEAAERFRVSGERWLEMPEGKPETEKEWEPMNDAREELFALLTGNAVGGEEKTK